MGVFAAKTFFGGLSGPGLRGRSMTWPVVSALSVSHVAQAVAPRI